MTAATVFADYDADGVTPKEPVKSEIRALLGSYETALDFIGDNTAAITTDITQLTVQNSATDVHDVYDPVVTPGWLTSDGLRVVANMPAGSTVTGVNTIGLYAINNAASGGLGQNMTLMYGLIHANANDAAVWGLNPVLSDSIGTAVTAGTGKTLTGIELDFSVTSPNTVVQGISLIGTSVSQPAGANAVTVSSLSASALGTAYWTNAFVVDDNAALAALTIGASGSQGVSVAGIPIRFGAYDSASVGHYLDVKAVPTGAGTVGLSLLDNTANANGVVFRNGLSGSMPAIYPQGTDTNIGLEVIPKGSGVFTVTGDLTVTGDATIPFTQSGSGATARTLDAKSKESVSVLDFGAVAGGAAGQDNYPAFQAAIEAMYAQGGGNVHIPPGADKYRIKQAIQQRNGVHIHAWGADIHCTSDATGLYANFPTGGVVLFGVWTQADLAAITTYALNVLTAGGQSVTATTPADAANFAIGDVAIVGSTTTWNPGGFGVIPNYAQINVVEGVDAGTGVITLRHPIDNIPITSATIANLSDSGLNWDHAPGGDSGNLNWAVRDAGIHGGKWTTASQSMPFMYGGSIDCIVDVEYAQSRNGLVYGNLGANNIWQAQTAVGAEAGIELALLSHNNTVHIGTLTYNSTSAPTIRNIVWINEGSRDNKVSINRVNGAGHAADNVVLLQTTARNTVHIGNVYVDAVDFGVRTLDQNPTSGTQPLTTGNTVQLDNVTANSFLIPAYFANNGYASNNWVINSRFEGTPSGGIAVYFAGGTANDKDGVRGSYFSSGTVSKALQPTSAYIQDSFIAGGMASESTANLVGFNVSNLTSTARPYIGFNSNSVFDTVNVASLTASRLVVTDGSKNLVSTITSANLAASISDETGSGSAVFATSPTLVTPVLGVATGTSLNVSAANGLIVTNTFGGMGLLQTAGGIGWKWTLANTGHLYLQSTTDGFVGSSNKVFVSSTGGVSIGDTTDAGAGGLRVTGTTQLGTLTLLGGSTSSFPALKRSTTVVQARLADDSAFASVQGKLMTDTNYTAGAPGAATGYLTIYDATGTAYKVGVLV